MMKPITVEISILNDKKEPVRQHQIMTDIYYGAFTEELYKEMTKKIIRTIKSSLKKAQLVNVFYME